MIARLIGLTGHARSGKDTAAQALTERGGTRMAFADPVREALLALDPMVLHEPEGHHGGYLRLSEIVNAYGWEKAKRIPEVRRLLQRMDAEAGRDFHSEYVWTDRMWDRLRERGFPSNPVEPVVITDVRFANEAALIRRFGGIVVRIDRPGTGPANDHDSEALDFEPDAVIVNDGSVADLHAKVLALAGVMA